ncbi:MAG: [Fe-S]-binding protein [Oscillospiraceae bacterium]|nr:[Fe-S]-binding protein [Oscillospiraceae bacterium]
MPKVLRAEEMSKCIGCFTCMFVCAGVNRRDHSINKSCIRVRTSGGLSGRFVAVVCQGCQHPQCAEVCSFGALTPRPGGGVKLDPKHCMGCRRCEKHCIVHAIGFDQDAKKPIICHHCGACVRLCPHGCLSMEEPSKEIGASRQIMGLTESEEIKP